ncbi:MAG: sigma-70 family RNA polymerase sigma factor [Holophagales bacterium]|nr:sigma-70 family RNA polymerase sigma factor [Holophagales bacterium]
MLAPPPRGPPDPGCGRGRDKEAAIGSHGAITQLLQRWRTGEDEALEELTPLVYSELHRLAGQHMRFEESGHLLQTTALVNEAFLRLVGTDVDWRDRNHFFALASRLMRRVLVDFARRKNAEKRGGGVSDVLLDEDNMASSPGDAILALDQALDDFARLDPRKAEAIELRYFGGLKVREVASVVGCSLATVERDLRVAKAWLQRHLGGPAP